jgi:hypothetical protein
VDPAPSPKASAIYPSLLYFGGDCIHGHNCTTTVLVGEHMLVNVVCNNASCFCAPSKQFANSTGIGDHSPINLCFASTQQINPELQHRLFIAVIFLFPKVTHKLLKFSITRRIESDGFSRGAWLYLLPFQNLDKAHETSWKAEPSAWASWRAVTSMVGSWRWRDVCRIFRLVMAMMSLVVGQWLVRNWRSPRSNCRD